MAEQQSPQGDALRRELEQLRYLANSFDFLRLKAWTDWLTGRVPGGIEFLAHCLANCKDSHSQIFQDLFVDFVMAKRNGRFVEFGATNGVLRSNTLFLERRRGWTGVLAEPARCWHDELRRNRPACAIDTRCVWNSSGETLQFRETTDGELSTLDAFSQLDKHGADREDVRDRYPVATVSLNSLLDEHRTGRVDYLSIDTEGSERDILSAFDVDRFRPGVITVEHNHTAQRRTIFDLLTGHGYRRIFENLSTIDDWYVDDEVWRSLLARLDRPGV
jgi:FkbM family methyltransferase